MKYLNEILKQIFLFIAIMAWLSGIVIAKGFWSVFFSIVFMPWAWYLTVEKVLRKCSEILS